MPANVRIRRATTADADAMAAAHLDSIRSIGPSYYDAGTVTAWAAGVIPAMYVDAMAAGEWFHVALDDRGQVVGFSSHHLADGRHRTAVYVRGRVCRTGVGSALFRAAEADAVAAGAASIHVAASLAAVSFYKANGFEEMGRGEHRLPSGAPMACVFMRKTLQAR